jgi:sugar phosphate permease
VLGAGVIAQAAAASVLQGMPSLSPALRSQFGLSLTGLGFVLAATTVGLLVFLIPWGMLADRFGERWIMTIGLVLATGALGGASVADATAPLVLCLGLAGAACASVNAASGRAVILWFPDDERGFAMGARQTAIPLGAAVASLGLPAAADHWGLGAAFVVAGIGCLVGAVVVCCAVRDPKPSSADPIEGETANTALDRSRTAVAKLCVVSFLLVVPQLTVVGFLVVYLVDGHGVSAITAGALLAMVQFGGGVARIGLGWLSDRRRSRLGPLSVVAGVTALLFLVAVPAEASGGTAGAVVLVVAGIAAISWNGLAFTAVGELADPRRLGLTLGVQNTAVAAGMAVTPPLMGALVDATNWTTAFAVVAAVAALAAVALWPMARAETRQALQT